MAIHSDRMRRMFGDDEEQHEKKLWTHNSHLFCEQQIDEEGDYSVKTREYNDDQESDSQ